MNLQKHFVADYQIKAARTEPKNLDSFGSYLNLAALGINGEAGEVAQLLVGAQKQPNCKRCADTGRMWDNGDMTDCVNGCPPQSNFGTFAANASFIEEVKKECGDVYWYIALGCNRFDVGMVEVVLDDDTVLDTFHNNFDIKDYGVLTNAATASLALQLQAAQLAEFTKKINFHAQNFNYEKFRDHLRMITIALQTVHLEFGLPTQTVMEFNIAKLLKRYPEKFEPELSVKKLDEN